MSAVDDWLWDHRAQPWPERTGWFAGPLEGAPAQALYDRYKADMTAAERTVLTANDFGKALREAGHAKEKAESGHVYPSLTVLSRRERAEVPIRRTIREWGRARAEREAKAGHLARMHANGSDCDHPTPQSVIDGYAAAVDAYEATAVTDGTLRVLVAERYLPYLFAPFDAPGEPDPKLVEEWTALEIERRELGHRRVEAARPLAVPTLLARPAPLPGETPIADTATSMLEAMAAGVMGGIPGHRAPWGRGGIVGDPDPVPEDQCAVAPDWDTFDRAADAWNDYLKALRAQRYELAAIDQSLAEVVARETRLSLSMVPKVAAELPPASEEPDQGVW